MIGNDIVDLALARSESNWQRKGFLDKIFTKKEQNLILNSSDQEVMIWDLWSRKEAVYKIYNRFTNIRKFNPTAFECFDLEKIIGKVYFENQIFYTKSVVNKEFIYAIAVCEIKDFKQITTIKTNSEIIYIDQLPFYLDTKQQIKPISKTHHGRFEKIISINS